MARARTLCWSKGLSVPVKPLHLQCRVVEFIGPLLSDPPSEFTPPSWWGDIQASQPVIHVTQGTVATGINELIVPTLRALDQEDVLVIATTGGKPLDTLKLDSIPTNARVEQFIPHYSNRSDS